MIASHNSLTYLKPLKWWMRLFNFMAKCQSKDIKEQYEKYGVRMFDFRIDFNKDGDVLVQHGLMTYNIDRNGILEILNYLNRKRSVKYIKISLECTYKESKDIPQWKKDYFIEFCKYVEIKYKNIKFIGGEAKHIWKTVYEFKTTPLPDAISNYASNTTKCKLDDLWPWLYAKLHNKKAIANNTHDYIWLDFIEIQ